MIASPVPGRWWWFLVLVFAILVLVSAIAMSPWRSRPVAEAVLVDDADVDHLDRPLKAPAGPVTTTTPAGPVTTCLFLAPIATHPSWQLRLTSGYSGCWGSDVTRHFTIASTGEVTWAGPGRPVRHLALSSEQLALVRRLDQLSCVELLSGRPEYDWLRIGLDLGKHDQYAWASVSPASTFGREVTAMLDELAAGYRQARREVIGSIELRLATTDPGAVYRVRVAGGRLTVKRGHKLLVDDSVDPDLLVDLADAALERRAVDEPDVKGVLLMHGRSVPVRLARPWQGPFALIHLAIERARVLEGEPREPSHGSNHVPAGPAARS